MNTDETYLPCPICNIRPSIRVQGYLGAAPDVVVECTRHQRFVAIGPDFTLTKQVWNSVVVLWTAEKAGRSNGGCES